MYIRVYVYISYFKILKGPCFAVSLGCIHDEVRAEPGSWLVVGMIPVFDKKKAIRTKLRTEDGPMGASRRRIQITHQCIQALLEGWNTLTQNTKVLQWADGLWRRTRILLSAILTDQPEADTYCCDSAQSCKLCHCPKDKLHEPAQFPPKYAYSQESKVHRAADGLLNDKGCRGLMVMASGWQSFDRQFEPYLRAFGGALAVWPGMPFPNRW
jgi:hypothetical protein